MLFTASNLTAFAAEPYTHHYDDEEPYNEDDYIIYEQHEPQDIIPVSERFPAEPAKIFCYDEIDNADYGEEGKPAGIRLMSAPSSYTSVAASATNIVTEPTYSMSDGFGEYISPHSGEMSLKFDDNSLSGLNGLDFNVGRTYQTNQAILGDKYIDPETMIEHFDYSTYLQNRYALGTGWGFAFPSVEVYGDPDDDPDLYYHTGNGNVYHVNFDSTDSNLEGYYAENMVFKNDYDGSSYEEGSAIVRYYVRGIDGTNQYFAKDGRLIAIVDRFGNELSFNYVVRPVSNIIPNGLFSYEEDIGLWTMSGPKIGYDNGILKFSSTVSNTSDATSAYIEVEPNTDYILTAWVNFGTGLSDKYSGTVKIEEYEYNSSKIVSGFNTVYTSNVSDQVSGRQKIQCYFETDAEDR